MSLKLAVSVTHRVVFVGGSRGTSPSLDLTFPPTGLSENLGEWKWGGTGKGKGKGGGDHLPYSPPLASASNTTLSGTHANAERGGDATRLEPRARADFLPCGYCRLDIAL